MRIKADIYEEMREFFKSSPFFERGCVLGSENGLITHIYKDEGNRQEGEYVPDIDRINVVLEEWFEKGVDFVGLAHSHPNGLVLMSKNDEEYMEELKRLNELDIIYFPIASFDRNGNYLIKAYALKEEAIYVEDIEIVP